MLKKKPMLRKKPTLKKKPMLKKKPLPADTLSKYNDALMANWYMRPRNKTPTLTPAQQALLHPDAHLNSHPRHLNVDQAVVAAQNALLAEQRNQTKGYVTGYEAALNDFALALAGMVKRRKAWESVRRFFCRVQAWGAEEGEPTPPPVFSADFHAKSR